MSNLKKPIAEFNSIKDLQLDKFKVKNSVNEVEGDNLTREILLIQDKNLGIVPYYLNETVKGEPEFTVHTKQGFKLISEMQPNLLRKEYWLISDHGSMGGVNPPKQSYSQDVLDNYLNHILITSNFSIMDKIVSEGFYIPIVYNGKEYRYKPRFITTLPHDVYEKYIRTRLDGLYNWKDLEYIISFITSSKYNKKDILNIVDIFANNSRYKVSETIKSLGEDISFTVNRVVKSILLKQPLEKWRENFKNILNDYGEIYLKKALQNNMENALKLKTLESIKDKDKFKVKYMKTYIDSVDMLDIIYLKAIIGKKEDFRLTAGKIIKYVNNPTKDLVEEYKGGL